VLGELSISGHILPYNIKRIFLQELQALRLSVYSDYASYNLSGVSNGFKSKKVICSDAVNNMPTGKIAAGQPFCN
jgi:hypothetical protein